MKLHGLSHDIFINRYAYPGDKDWEDRAKTIARVIASAENDENKEDIYKLFWNTLKDGDLMPGGRIIFGAGRHKFNMLNCYVLWPDDSVESIGKTISDAYQISCGGGGIGFDFSRIRPRGDDIQNIKNSAPGSVSVMKMINEIGEHVRSGKNRRTALMGILRCDHPDLLQFLDAKLQEGQLSNFNISVAITNTFIKAVEENKEWSFVFKNRVYHTFVVSGKNDLGSVLVEVIGLDERDAIERATNFLKPDYKTIFDKADKIELKARAIWDRIFKSAIESGDPGIYNVDYANEYTNVNYFEYLPSTNPCGEITIPNYGNCCLGHVNLSNMISDDGNIDWKKIAKTVRTGIRFLDNVLTINHFPITECKEVGHRSRRIGLGVTGLHYFLIKAGYKYGDEKCCEFTERLFQTIRDEAYKASIELAKEKGSFAAFDAKKYLDEGFAKTLPARIKNDIKKHGIRNAVMLTCAPCGTNSMVLEVSTGIEPIFSPVYIRKYKENNVWKEQVIIDPLFKKLFENADPRLRLCIGAYDVTPEEHIRIQASIQKYIDQSLSKTCNLPENTTYSDVSDIVLNYAPYVKGFTIYRSGSKGIEPLKAISIIGLNKEEISQIINGNIIQNGPSICDISGKGCE